MKFVIPLTFLALALSFLMYESPSFIHKSFVGFSSPEEKLANRQLVSFRTGTKESKTLLVGFNGCLDVVMNLQHFLMGVFKDQVEGEICQHLIERNWDSMERGAIPFLETATYHFNQGIAGERMLLDRKFGSLLTDLILDDAIQAMIIPGGNAVNMANVLALQGHSIELCVPFGPKLKTMLNEKVQLAGSEGVEDVFHFIFEFKKGEEMCGKMATRSNRFILSLDDANSRLHGSSCLSRKNWSGIDGIIVSGLHMMQPLEQKEQEMIISGLERLIDDMPLNLPVHFELASISDIHLIRRIAWPFLRKVHSVGFNEQEFISLISLFSGNENLMGKTSVTMSELVTGIRKIFENCSGEGAKLSRVHYHDPQTHCIALLSESEIVWKEGAMTDSLLSGAAAGSASACGLTSVNEIEKNTDLFAFVSRKSLERDMMGRLLDTPFSHSYFLDSGKEFTVACTPLLFCLDVNQTVGLGDTISASGFTVHLK